MSEWVSEREGSEGSGWVSWKLLFCDGGFYTCSNVFFFWIKICSQHRHKTTVVFVSWNLLKIKNKKQTSKKNQWTTSVSQGGKRALSLSLCSRHCRHRFMVSLLLFVVFLKKSLFLVKNVISFTTPMYSKCLKALPTWSDLKQLFFINGDWLWYP